MPGSFSHKRINVYFSQGLGATGQAGNQTSSLLGKRISAKIVLPGLEVNGTCSLQIYGMRLEDMNSLSKATWIIAKKRPDTVLVEAGDDENGMNEVFKGTIGYAWPDMTNQPQVVFRVEAQTGLFDGVKPAEPTSFKGPTPFDTIGNTISKKFHIPRIPEFNGIKKMIENPYYYGSPLSQFKALAKAARVAWIDENEKTLAAWPFDKPRAGGGSGVFSKDTGMVTDPIATPSGIIVKKLFTKPIKSGTQITVQSILTQANGPWNVRRVEYSLESEMPHGEWFVTIDGYRAT